MNETHLLLLHAHEALWQIRQELLKLPPSERLAAMEEGLRQANASCPDPDLAAKMGQAARDFLQDVMDE